MAMSGQLVFGSSWFGWILKGSEGDPEGFGPVRARDWRLSDATLIEVRSPGYRKASNDFGSNFNLVYQLNTELYK
jgi:hypothetical protein